MVWIVAPSSSRNSCSTCTTTSAATIESNAINGAPWRAQASTTLPAGARSPSPVTAPRPCQTSRLRRHCTDTHSRFQLSMLMLMLAFAQGPQRHHNAQSQCTIPTMSSKGPSRTAHRRRRSADSGSSDGLLLAPFAGPPATAAAASLAAARAAVGAPGASLRRHPSTDRCRRPAPLPAGPRPPPRRCRRLSPAHYKATLAPRRASAPGGHRPPPHVAADSPATL